MASWYDSLVQGESMGMPNGMGGQKPMGLLDNPALQMGLGILANNQGNYGSFGAALGKGGLMGMQNIQRQQEAMRQQKMMDMHMKQIQMQQDKQAKLDKWNESYGVNNTDATVPGGYANAPQGADAPNFNMVKQPDTVQPNASFDQNKWLMSGIGAGAINPMDVIKMQKGEADYGYSDGVLYDKKTGKYQQIGGSAQKPTTNIQDYEYAVSQGYKGDITDFIKIKPNIMAGVAYGNLGINQEKLQLDQEKAAYERPSPVKPMKSFSVNVGGKTYNFPDQKSLNNFKLRAGVR